jgi:hypothetical protein
MTAILSMRKGHSPSSSEQASCDGDLGYPMTLMLLASSNGTVVLPPIWVS